jgi:beta-glucosidase
VKHYALNDQETNRATDSSDADERTMQEIDLPPFEAAVKAGVASVMCSYNRVNSIYACENPTLLRTYLDTQFGFTGWVMSDWGATHSTVASANAGLDMEMPSGTYYGSALQAAVQNGSVTTATLNDMVSRILLPMFRLGLFDHVPAEGDTAANANASTPDHIALATKVAEQGAVLLKNVGGVLPISGAGKKIAVIGTAAGPMGAPLAAQGYGSAHVPLVGLQTSTVSPLQSITTRAQQDGDTVTYADSSDASAAAAVAGAADTAIVFIYDTETEGLDRTDLNAHSGTCSVFTGCTFDTTDQNALVSAVAAANPHTIVVVQSGGPTAMPWLSQVSGVVEDWFPGQVDGDAIAPLLFGDVNFSGKLPLTFPKSLADDPLQSTAQYPGVTVDGDTVGPHSTYSEGLLVGYRWYDAKGIQPLFPFGYGLSYTTFAYSGLSVSSTASGASVSFTITNTGTRAGAEVAQVYLAMPAAAGEPPKQLKGFQKVSLNPGASTRVTIPLDTRAFQYWDSSAHNWATTHGAYTVMVGGSSGNLPLQGTVRK